MWYTTPSHHVEIIFWNITLNPIGARCRKSSGIDYGSDTRFHFSETEGKKEKRIYYGKKEKKYQN